MGCSLLRGSGYNAFVVYGIAKRHITQNDQTNADINDDILESTKWHFNEDDDYNDNDDDAQNDKLQDDESSDIPEFYKYTNNKTKKNNNLKSYKEYLMEKENLLENQKK